DAACRLAPAGSAPIVGGDRHKIDEPAALDRIMNEMRIAPEPQMDQPFAEFGRDFACRQERPPGGAPSETRGTFRCNPSPPAHTPSAAINAWPCSVHSPLELRAEIVTPCGWVAKSSSDMPSRITTLRSCVAASLKAACKSPRWMAQ